MIHRESTLGRTLSWICLFQSKLCHGQHHSLTGPKKRQKKWPRYGASCHISIQAAEDVTPVLSRISCPGETIYRAYDELANFVQTDSSVCQKAPSVREPVYSVWFLSRPICKPSSYTSRSCMTLSRYMITLSSPQSDF